MVRHTLGIAAGILSAVIVKSGAAWLFDALPFGQDEFGHHDTMWQAWVELAAELIIGALVVMASGAAITIVVWLITRRPWYGLISVGIVTVFFALPALSVGGSWAVDELGCLAVAQGYQFAGAAVTAWVIARRELRRAPSLDEEAGTT